MMVMNSYTNCSVVNIVNDKSDIGLDKRKNKKETFVFFIPYPLKKTIKLTLRRFQKNARSKVVTFCR